MYVYQNGSFGRGTIICAPGADHPETSAWVNKETKRPFSYTVKFKGGRAEVEDRLGEYLIDHGYAFRSPIFMPESAVA